MDDQNAFLAAACPVPLSTHKHIVLAHGGGGKLTHDLIQRLIQPRFTNPFLDGLHDGAVFSVKASQLAFSTDSFVVNPIFFPGGDIGSLAVHGTVNDLAMCGARPLYLSAAFILEEGLAIEDFERVLDSMQQAARNAGISLVTGDTKVVDRGKGDQLFINTSGIGVVRDGAHIHPTRARPGDKILINGPIAAHGIAIMSLRESLAFESQIVSDTAPLHSLVDAMFKVCPDIHVLRDPTRGGLTSTLNEIAEQARLGIHLQETAIPIAEEVKAACEILGLDPLYVANEGKLLAVIAPESCDAVLAAMKTHPLGREAAVIGEVLAERPGLVTMKTRIGGTRVVDMLSGEQLPRIC